jgi:DNA-directed RNA polymerase subunit RPC12/RpoP
MLALPDEDGRGVPANVVEIREGEMICIECGGKYIDKHGTVVLSGISLEGVDYTECAQCGNRSYGFWFC